MGCRRRRIPPAVCDLSLAGGGPAARAGLLGHWKEGYATLRCVQVSISRPPPHPQAHTVPPSSSQAAQKHLREGGKPQASATQPGTHHTAHLALRLIQRRGEHLALDRQVLDAEGGHQPLDAVAAKDAEEVVLQGEEVAGGPRVALQARKERAKIERVRNRGGIGFCRLSRKARRKRVDPGSPCRGERERKGKRGEAGGGGG